MIITRFSGYRDPQGWVEDVDPLALVRGEIAYSRETCAGWSAATFRGNYRSKANVVDVGALVLDYDHGPELDVIRARWADCNILVHATWHHMLAKNGEPPCPRYRVIMPFNRRYSPAEYAKVWAWARRRDSEIDPACSDPSRFWFVPAICVSKTPEAAPFPANYDVEERLAIVAHS